jgi:hypothetical protein
MERAGSGMNERRRSGAWFQERPLSATLVGAFDAICLAGF